MIRTRYLILFMVFLALLLTPTARAEDINESAYQNRFLLKAGTVLNDEQRGQWRGVGDCLIFPYYDARQLDGKKQTTLIKIKNIGEYGIVAKLRVREWSRGKEVFSKDIWIPSSSLSDDVAWQGTIESNADGTNVVISSFDYVISRNDTNSFYLSGSLSSGSPFSTKNIRKINGESTLYGSIEVIGEEKTSPEKNSGRVTRLAKAERDCPNTLLGKVLINRLEEGVSMTYDAVAIGNFSRGQGSLFVSPGNSFPRLDTCEDSLDQLEFQLSKWEIYGPYALDPSNQGKTSLIITYPTKFFHYQNGSRINQVNNPFEGLTETQGELVETALSEQGQEFVDSSIKLPYSVNVIGLYKDYDGKPFGIDNVTMPTFSPEFGEATLTSGNLSQRVLIADYEYYKEGRFSMYKGLPAVGLVLQESRNSGELSASLTPVEYSTLWVPSNVETISTPATPSGSSSGLVNVSYVFTASGSSSSLGHSIQYLFDWGDGTNSDWLPVGITSVLKAWTMGGAFTVRVRARCATHTDIVSNWSKGLVVNITPETVSAPTTPSGPLFGVVNKDNPQSYTYTTGGSVSSQGHPVEYQFDWKGDGSDLSGWGPFLQSKAWTEGGVFTVRARARCATHTDIVSNWSNGLAVTVESISSPTMLGGPTIGMPNTQYTYSTGGALSNLGHPVQYLFDWGDKTDSGWLPVGTTTATKSWSTGGQYAVKTKARCATDLLAVSDWTPGLTVTIESVSTPTTPVGPTTGDLGVSYSFSTGGAVSNMGHPVEYQFDWGDGSLSSWGPSTQSKSWNSLGSFVIKARGRCVTHPSVVSDWSSGLTFVIERVTVPSQPNGPLNGMRGIPLTFTVSGAISTLGDPLEYQFDWGDNSTSPWTKASVDPDTGQQVATQQKVWTTSGTYTVRARARCSLHPTLVSDWSSGLVVVIEFVSIPVAPTGPTSGTVGVGYQYTTGGSSSDRGDPVQYQFNWGDGTISEWLPIGTTSVGKAWANPGTYAVRARARCGVHTVVISDWSPVLTVTLVPGLPPPTETISPPFIEAYGPTDRGSIYTAGNIISGRRSIPYTFTFRSGVSSLGHAVEHQFDWGDGTFSDWGSSKKAWSTSGTYLIKVRARCVQHPTVVSDWSGGIYVVIDYITAPNRPTWDDQPADGLGHVGVAYHFSTGGSTSEIGQEIQYRFYWGDAANSNSGWLPVGTTTASYTYTTQGTYTVRVDARGWRYLGADQSTEHFSYYSPELMVTIRNP